MEDKAFFFKKHTHTHTHNYVRTHDLFMNWDQNSKRKCSWPKNSTKTEHSVRECIEEMEIIIMGSRGGGHNGQYKTHTHTHTHTKWILSICWYHEEIILKSRLNSNIGRPTCKWLFGWLFWNQYFNALNPKPQGPHPPLFQKQKK
jgi:hypothetical protein